MAGSAAKKESHDCHALVVAGCHRPDAAEPGGTAAALLAEVPLPASDPDEALRRLYQAQLAELKLERSGGRLSETDHAQAVEELQRRLLSELDRPRASVAWRQSPWLRRGSALLLAVLLPVAAFALYLQVGDPKAAAQLAQEQPDAHGDGAGDTQVQAMVDGLARRLEEQPQNLPGWVMLARSYETLERLTLRPRHTGGLCRRRGVARWMRKSRRGYGPIWPTRWHRPRAVIWMAKPARP
jgi:cytochrome c-type biogenesis protein CcmI